MCFHFCETQNFRTYDKITIQKSSVENSNRAHFCFISCYRSTRRQCDGGGNLRGWFSIPGVTIFIEGTQNGTTTDVQGKYKLNNVSPESTIVFSFIGMKTLEVKYSGQLVIDAVLESEVIGLDEIVIVGYGSQKKSVVTGSISTIGAKELKDVPVQRVDQALQGRTSGVVVASNSGQPGSSATVRVRGITSLSDGANQPLWVVDGVIVDAGGIGYLNQSDIQSIEVLKDAASQAIYGARAAAGVILITTKQGSAGELKVSYTGFAGVSAPEKKLELLNAQEYAMLRNEASLAGGGNIISKILNL